MFKISQKLPEKVPKYRRRITIDTYGRYSKLGKFHQVSGYDRDISLTGISDTDLAIIRMGKLSGTDARGTWRKHSSQTHPDTKHINRITFKQPNKAWKNNPQKYDVLGFDAFLPPESRVGNPIGKYGIPNQIIQYKGDYYVANENGEFELDKAITPPKAPPVPIKSARIHQAEKSISSIEQKIMMQEDKLRKAKSEKGFPKDELNKMEDQLNTLKDSLKNTEKRRDQLESNATHKLLIENPNLASAVAFHPDSSNAEISMSIEHITDIQDLENIVITNEDIEIRRKSYETLKKLAPNSKEFKRLNKYLKENAIQVYPEKPLIQETLPEIKKGTGKRLETYKEPKTKQKTLNPKPELVKAKQLELKEKHQALLDASKKKSIVSRDIEITEKELSKTKINTQKWKNTVKKYEKLKQKKRDLSLKEDIAIKEKDALLSEMKKGDIPFSSELPKKEGNPYSPASRFTHNRQFSPEELDTETIKTVPLHHTQYSGSKFAKYNKRGTGAFAIVGKDLDTGKWRVQSVLVPKTMKPAKSTPKRITVNGEYYNFQKTGVTEKNTELIVRGLEVDKNMKTQVRTIKTDDGEIIYGVYGKKKKANNPHHIKPKTTNPHKDYLEGGLSDKYDTNDLKKRFMKKGFSEKEFEKEIKKGIKIELEHTDNKEISEEIARDHLEESLNWKNPKYYTGLEEMEEKMKKGSNP